MIKGLQTLARDLYGATTSHASHFRRGYSNGYTAEIAFKSGYLYLYDACLMHIYSNGAIVIHDTTWRGYSPTTTRALNTLKATFPNAIIE